MLANPNSNPNRNPNPNPNPTQVRGAARVGEGARRMARETTARVRAVRDCEDASALAREAGQRAVAELLLARDATARLYDDLCTAARVLARTGDLRDAAAKLRELRPWTGCVAKVPRSIGSEIRREICPLALTPG